EIFAATAATHANSVCHVVDGRKFTYAEVDAAATSIARGLLRRGVRPGDVIGLWLPRGGDLLVAQIAIAKTGAAWLPFDADAPIERIAVCLEDAEAKGLLTSSVFAEKTHGSMPCPLLIPTDIRDKEASGSVDAR